MSDALKLDFYELSMLDGFTAAGIENTNATFEVFARRLPKGYRYGVFAGIDRLLHMLRRLRFTGSDLDYLHREFGERLGPDTFTYLTNLGYSIRWDVTVTAFEEGEIFFPDSPVLTVEGPLGQLVLLETLILSVLNHDSGIATKAARIVNAAQGRPVIEMGSRRTHEESAVDAARAAMVAGFTSTSNVEAGKRYGVPVAGTAAHAFTLAFPTEREAFIAQLRTQGPETTLLIDTYDVEQGVMHAIEAWHALWDENYRLYQMFAPKNEAPFAYPALGGVRIDSGDLAENAKLVREKLDFAGFQETKIVATSDLDEHVITDLIAQGAPIDVFGVGTKLVSAPPMGFVYKLVERQDSKNIHVMRPVSKRSADKVSVGGKKRAWRRLDAQRQIKAEERHAVDNAFTGLGRPLQHEYGVLEDVESLPNLTGWERANSRYLKSLAELPVSERKVWPSAADSGAFTTSQAIGFEILESEK